MAKKQKSEELDETLKMLEEKFGPGTIIPASSEEYLTVKDKIPTGSLTLNLAIDGGIPVGKAICILGKESSSKTTLGYHMLKEAQLKYPEKPVVFEDIEDSWDSQYAESIGLDLKRVHIVDSQKLLKHLGVKDRTKVSAEEWLKLGSDLIQLNIYSALLLDSIAALQPMAEIENGLQGGRLAGIATVMSRAYREYASALRNSDTTFIYTNQYRMNPGAYNPLVEPGGEAWRYLQHLKLEISKSLDKDTDGVHGIIVKGKVSKSKVCQPHRTFEYYVGFGQGIVKSYEIINLGIEQEVITKTGNTYTYGETKLGVGMGQLETFLNDNPELMKEIEDKLLEKLYTKPQEIIETTENQ